MIKLKTQAIIIAITVILTTSAFIMPGCDATPYVEQQLNELEQTVLKNFDFQNLEIEKLNQKSTEIIVNQNKIIDNQNTLIQYAKTNNQNINTLVQNSNLTLIGISDILTKIEKIN